MYANIETCGQLIKRENHSIKLANSPNKHEIVKTEMLLSTATSTKVSLPIKQRSIPIIENNFSPTDKSILTLKESTNNFIKKFSDSFQKNDSSQNGAFSKKFDNPISDSENKTPFLVNNRDCIIGENIKIQEKIALKE